MSFNMKVISNLNDKNAHVFSMFCDLCVTRMVHFRLKSILVTPIFPQILLWTMSSLFLLLFSSDPVVNFCSYFPTDPIVYFSSYFPIDPLVYFCSYFSTDPIVARRRNERGVGEEYHKKELR